MKKFPRLPNGYGSIRNLGKGRKKPFIVLPPSSVERTDAKGVLKYGKPLAYTSTWGEAFSVLIMYHSGTWEDGKDPIELMPEGLRTKYIDEIVKEIIKKVAPTKTLLEPTKGNTLSFEEVGRRCLNEKYNGKRTLSESTRATDLATFKSLEPLYNKPMDLLSYPQLQGFINVDNSRSVYKAKKVGLIKQICRYAMKYEIITKDPSVYLESNVKNDVVNGENFTLEDLKKLYEDRGNPISEMIVIMCYTGFRISEFLSLKIDLEKRLFIGGIKTKASKNRTVPIHSFIFKLVEKRYRLDPSNILLQSPDLFRHAMYKRLKCLGIKRHKPHDCRHTFSYLCTKYGVNEIQKKRLLGHSFIDVTNSVYGHTDTEILRAEIEKIKPIDSFLN